MADTFDLGDALQDVIHKDADAVNRLGLIENESDGEIIDSEEHIRECRALVDNLLKKLQDKQNAIVFFHDKNAHIALSQLDSAEQAAFWVDAKKACKGLNLVDARRVVREASDQEKRKKTGAALSQGLIQRHGAYYIEKMTTEGPVSVSISNFTVEPLLKVQTDDGKSFLKVNVFIGGSEVPIWRFLSTNDFLGRKELLKALDSVDAQWTGNDQNVQMLVGHLANVDTPVKHGVPYIGFYEDRFITPDTIFTEKGSEPDSKYIYLPQSTAFERHICFPPCEDWPALAKKILELIPYIQPLNVIWPVTGWFFACPISQRIRKSFNEFPIMLCWGTGGGGKSSIVMLFLYMLGVSIEPIAALGKEFVLIKNLSVTNALPIPLDEYSSQKDPKKAKILHEKLLLCYKASIDGRGRPDQRTVEYKLMAPVVMAGESPLPETETGLMERVLQVRFDKNFINVNSEAEEKFNKLTNLPLLEFAAGYVVWLMKWDIEDIFQTALRQINKILVNMKVALRIKHNLAVVLTGIILFHELAKEVGAQLPKVNLESILRQFAGEDLINRKEPRNAVDRFMLHMADMAHTGELHYGIDYTLDDSDMPKLFFYTSAVIGAQQKYCKVRGLDLQVISDKALRVMLEEKISSYILIPFGYVKKIGPKALRTTVIDAKKLEEQLGIDVDIWRNRKNNNWYDDTSTEQSEKPDNMQGLDELFNED